LYWIWEQGKKLDAQRSGEGAQGKKLDAQRSGKGA